MLGPIRDLIRPDPDRPALVVDSLTETFRLYHERPSGLKERLYRLRRARYTNFNALESVTFSVDHGDSLGIIGPNGSGKSTLLKVLARILPPDDGRVTINGRVASLLELGAGFHGDLSGRENIYLNGAILGLTRNEIDERFDEIVDFAGVRPFLDTAVRNYSSGMYVRLGFAIAVNVDPDILLVDEVLAVGDAAFQTRSLDRMRTFRQRGKTIVVVSHDLDAVQALCDRVLVLDGGQVVFDGPAQEGVALYAQRLATAGEVGDGPRRLHSGAVRITDAVLLDGSGAVARSLPPSSPLTLRIRIEAQRDIDVVSVGAVFDRGDDTRVYEVHTTWQGLGVGPLEAGQAAVVDIRCTAHVLAGHYHVTPVVTDPTGRVSHTRLVGRLSFDVLPAPGATGLADFAAATSVSEGPALRLGADAASGHVRRHDAGPGSRGIGGAAGGA